MESAPSPAEIIQRWVFDPFWLCVVVALAVTYALAFRKSRGGTFVHPRYRLLLFMGGVAVVGLATLSPVAHYSKGLLWVDFTGFLMLTMIAPPLMLMGAPLTLAFRISGPRGRRMLRRAYRSRLVSILTFPIASWLLFAVLTYLWQFTSLTDEAVTNAPLRVLQQFTLLLVGLLFWTPALAADPLRWRLPYPLRSLYVFVEMTHKGLFGGMFLSMNTAMHTDFASRAPAWAPSAITDQRIAILILWIGGNMIFLVALTGLVLRWVSYEQRNQRRTDLRLALQAEAKRKRRAALDQVFTRPV
ncbi:MAG: cytochrome c oxidase assembly protein [Dehalococcoidia bacterium]